MLVREPDELGLERTHPQLALGARLVELAEANGHVAAAGTPELCAQIAAALREA